MSRNFNLIPCWLCFCAILFVAASNVAAQRPRFGQTLPPRTQIVPPPARNFGGQAGQPLFPAPSATIVTPPFDPFQGNSQLLPFGNSAGGAADTVPSLGLGQPNEPFAPFNSFGSGGSGLNFQQPLFGGSQAFPRTGQSGQFFQRFRNDFLPRLLERPRIRHTFIPGQNGNELQINDTEFATTLTIPRFLFSNQPISITPGFIAHFWDGPETDGPFGTGFDLPDDAFSAFLTLEHTSDQRRRAGTETNFTVGIYSDYEHLDSDSLRFTGVALGWFRLNPTNVFKIGIEYFDRLDVKLLPAFGLFIRPTEDLEIDLYFPRPRIAQRLPNFRGLQTWMYVAGEYGGGNWTVERAGGLDDRIDINDYRALLGIEWVGRRGGNAFVEVGYVFDRELVSFAAIPSRRLELQDAFLLRLGVQF